MNFLFKSSSMLVILGCTLIGCNKITVKPQTDSEKLGLTACRTNGVHKQSDIPVGSMVIDRYNWLAHGLIQSSLNNGFILGFEKLEPLDRTVYTNLQNSHLGRYTAQNAGYLDEHKTRNKEIAKRLNDVKPLALTHIAEYKNSNYTPLANVYLKDNGTFHHKSTDIDRSLTNSLNSMNNIFFPSLKSRISSGEYTHIVFMSMGWNNDQGVSICRMSTLMDQTVKQLQNKFKPLVIGVTWPSVIFGSAKTKSVRKIGHFGSVFNKANDGDELGLFFGNMILNRLIPQANTKNLPVVVVGHSYGARIVARAPYSRELLKNGAVGDGPDLLALLQPAFSARRFVAGDSDGIEGAPFAPIEGTKTVTVGTTSVNDAANRVAVWSAHFGGTRGWKYVQESKSAQEVYDYVKSMPLKEVIKSTKSAVAGRPVMVDASQFVDNHNDVYGPNMGEFLSGLITQHAPAQSN